MLRRLSLNIAFGEDATPYTRNNQLKKSPSSHFRAKDIQAERIVAIFDSENPWLSWLTLYPEFRQWVPCIAEDQKQNVIDIQTKVMDLYAQHAQEWLSARHLLKQ